MLLYNAATNCPIQTRSSFFTGVGGINVMKPFKGVWLNTALAFESARFEGFEWFIALGWFLLNLLLSTFYLFTQDVYSSIGATA
jgi:hypothetical protein